MTDTEIDLFVQALLLPPPWGFTKDEREQILRWLKSSNYFGKIRVSNNRINFFTYGKDAEEKP